MALLPGRAHCTCISWRLSLYVCTWCISNKLGELQAEDAVHFIVKDIELVVAPLGVVLSAASRWPRKRNLHLL